MKYYLIFLIAFFCPLSFAIGQDASVEARWTPVADNAPWTARDSAGEVVFERKMWLLGGWTIASDGSFKRLNDVWRTGDGISWEQVTPSAPWPARNLPGSVVFNGEIWILGGCDGKKSLNDVWHSPDGAKWSQSPTPPWKPRTAFGYAVFDGCLWVAGGFEIATDEHFDDVWRTRDGRTWERIADHAPWEPRSMFPLEVFDGKLWLFGGGVYGEKSTNFHDVWTSADGRSWQKASADAGWAERRFHIITVFDSAFWLFGGVTDGNVNLNDVWHSTDGVSWEIVDKSAPWGVRHEQMCLVFDERLWMFGGFSGDKSGEKVYRDTWMMEAVK